MKLKMNKFVAVLCLVTMIVSTIVPMFAFTANAADNVSETISFANTDQRTEFSSTQQVWKSENVTFTNDKASSGNNIADYSNPVRLYQGSTITFSAPGAITEISITCNTGKSSYKTALEGSLTTAGFTYTNESNVYTFNPGTKEVTISITAQTRFNSVTVTYIPSDAPACEHTSTTAIGEAVDATCTTDGITAGVKCANCGHIITAQETIPATGHTFVGGVCECGAEEGALPPVPAEPQKYVFSDYTAGAQYADNEEHVLDDILTVYTTDAHFTSELRIYSSSTYNGYAILDSKLPISALAFNAGNKVDTLVVYGSSNGSDWDTIAKVSITSTSYNDYTVDFGGKAYNYIKLDVEGTQQVRLKNMTVTYTAPGECTHHDTTFVSYVDGVHNLTCNDCGEPVTVTSHNYVEEACAMCGVPEYPVYTIPEANAAPDNTTLKLENVEVVEIKDAYSSQYNNISLIVKDAEGNEFYCYRLKGNWNLGDVITVKGTKTTYKGVIEFNAGCTATKVSEGGFNVNAGAVQLLNGTTADSASTSARLVLTLTAADLAKLDNVGVYFSLTEGADANGVKKSTTTVFTSVNANGMTVEAADGTYYVLVEISNIPQASFGTTIYVRPFVTVDDAEYLGAEVSFSVNGVLNPEA